MVNAFCNLITNIRKEEFNKWLGNDNLANIQIEVNGKKITGINRTFSDVEPKKLVAYFGSSNRLEIAVRNDSAAETLRVTGGDPIRIQRS